MRIFSRKPKKTSTDKLLKKIQDQIKGSFTKVNSLPNSDKEFMSLNADTIQNASALKGKLDEFETKLRDYDTNMKSDKPEFIGAVNHIGDKKAYTKLMRTINKARKELEYYEKHPEKLDTTPGYKIANDPKSDTLRLQRQNDQARMLKEQLEDNKQQFVAKLNQFMGYDQRESGSGFTVNNIDKIKDHHIDYLAKRVAERPQNKDENHKYFSDCLNTINPNLKERFEEAYSQATTPKPPSSTGQ